MDPLEALKSRRQTALSRRSDPLDELKRRKTLAEDTALSPLMEDEPFAVSRPSLPAGPRRSQMLPAVVTTAEAPKAFTQTLSKAIQKENKKSAPYGREEDLTPEQQRQLARAQYGRAVTEDIGKAFAGQPSRTVYRTATGIANLRNDPRAKKLAETLARVEAETAPTTGIGAVARLGSEMGAFMGGGMFSGAVRSGLESAAGEEFSTASMLSELTGKGKIKDARLRAVADAGIDLAIPGMISAVKATKSLREALKVGDDLAKAFERGAKEGASEGAESVVGSFARKDGYRPRATPETNAQRLIPSRASQTVPTTAQPAATPTARRRTAAQVLERRPAFEQTLPEGATPEEMEKYIRRRAPLSDAVERAETSLANQISREEVFGTPSQRRERLSRVARLLRPEVRGPNAPALPESVLEQVLREVEGEIPRPRGEEAPDFLRNVPTDEIIKEIDEIASSSAAVQAVDKAMAQAGKSVPVNKLTDSALEAEVIAREARLADAQSLIQAWEERTLGVIEQFKGTRRSAYLTPEMRAKQTRSTQVRNPVTGELMETAAERRARERGISDEDLARLEEAGFADRDDFLSQKKEIDKLRFSMARLQKSRDAAQAEYARRTGVPTPVEEAIPAARQVDEEILPAAPTEIPPATKVAAPEKKQYTVNLRFQHPAWDEKDGIDFIVTAANKAEAVAQARREADRAGHLSGGKGRVTLKTTKEEAVRESFLGGEEAAVSPGVAASVGTTSLSGAVGAATAGEDATFEDRLRRGLLFAGGAAAGAGAVTAGVRRMGRGTRVAPSIPELAPVAETINVGRRTPAPATPGILTSYQKFYNNLVSETFVLEKTAERYGGAANERAIQGAIAKQQGAQQSAKQYLLTTLSPILQSLDEAEKESLRSLLKGRRDLQIRQRGGAAKSAVSTADLDAGVTAGNANPKIAAAADAITQAHRDLLTMRKDVGLLTDEAYQAIVASDDFYTPLYRELAEDQSISLSLPGSRTGKFGVGSTGVRRMDRTVEALENTADPLEMLAADALRTYRDVGKQRVANIIFDLVDTGTNSISSFVRRIQADPTRPPRRDGVIQQVRNGKLYTYEVSDPDLFKALAGQDNVSSNAIVNVAQTMKNLKTSGIVVLPDFAAANVIRDVAMSGLQRPDLARAARESALGAALGGALGAASAEGDESAVRRFLIGAGLGAGVALYARPFVETMGAVKSIVFQDGLKVGGKQILSPDKAFAEFLANGASTEGFYIKNANDAAAAVKELAKGPGFSLDDIIIPTNWWETLRKIGSVGEQSTRLAAYRQVLEAGGQVDDAVRAAQDRTLRFANIGASRTVKGLASMTPFWNAKVQGWDKLARMMNPKKNPQTYALGAAMLTGPSIALWSINKDNPEYWERPTYEKNLFWLVPKSAVHGDDSTGFYRIPKPFELGFMFASLPERALDYAAQKGLDIPLIGQIQSAAPKMADPGRALARSALDIGAATMEGTLPVPEIVSLPGQLIANRDLFRNRPIVTRPNLPTELQATKESSAIARALSRAGVSPEKTDFAIRGLFGTAGGEASKAIDAAARAAGLPAPEAPEGASKVPLVGRFAERFTTSNRGQSEPEALARDQIRELSKVEAGFREHKRLGNQADILDYAKRNRSALLLADRIQPLERELDKLASLRTKITKAPNLTGEQKRQALEVLRVRGAALSRQMLTVPSPEDEQE